MKYEYKTMGFETKGLSGGKVDYHKFEEMLNQLGASGWELVNSLPSNRDFGHTGYIISIFKRPMQ